MFPSQLLKSIVNECLDRADAYQRRAAELHAAWDETGDPRLEVRMDSYNARAAHRSDVAWRLAFPGT